MLSLKSTLSHSSSKTKPRPTQNGIPRWMETIKRELFHRATAGLYDTFCASEKGTNSAWLMQPQVVSFCSLQLRMLTDLMGWGCDQHTHDLCPLYRRQFSMVSYISVPIARRGTIFSKMFMQQVAWKIEIVSPSREKDVLCLWPRSLTSSASIHTLWLAGLLAYEASKILDPSAFWNSHGAYIVRGEEKTCKREH